MGKAISDQLNCARGAIYKRVFTDLTDSNNLWVFIRTKAENYMATREGKAELEKLADEIAPQLILPLDHLVIRKR